MVYIHVYLQNFMLGFLQGAHMSTSALHTQTQMSREISTIAVHTVSSAVFQNLPRHIIAGDLHAAGLVTHGFSSYEH
jgi:hypothetical protein